MSEHKPWELVGPFAEVEHDKAWRAWRQTDHSIPLGEYIGTAIANAAVKKVVGWMNENGKIAYDRHAIASEFTVVDSEFTVPIHKWQSLKQEVGL